MDRRPRHCRRAVRRDRQGSDALLEIPTNIIATMLSGVVEALLTPNPKDFGRFGHLEAIG